VLETPGHTLEHIAHHCPAARALFPGDTLFTLGCGLMFEGDAEMMWGSLARLKALPPDTRVGGVVLLGSGAGRCWGLGLGVIEGWGWGQLAVAGLRDGEWAPNERSGSLRAPLINQQRTGILRARVQPAQRRVCGDRRHLQRRAGRAQGAGGRGARQGGAFSLSGGAGAGGLGLPRSRSRLCPPFFFAARVPPAAVHSAHPLPAPPPLPITTRRNRASRRCQASCRRSWRPTPS